MSRDPYQNASIALVLARVISESGVHNEHGKQTCCAFRSVYEINNIEQSSIMSFCARLVQNKTMLDN